MRLAREKCRTRENGTYEDLDEVAKAEKIGPSFVSRVIRSSLLAPDIVNAIREGRPPTKLGLRGLMKALPVEWAGRRHSECIA